MSGGALHRDGFPVWRERLGGARIGFTGRGPARNRKRALAAAGGGSLPLAWARQVHSARVLEAAPGACGEGDALILRAPGLAVSVAAADCVPLVVSARDRLAAIHAGWRGIAAGVVAAALARLERPGRELEVWIGPAIGACCYEVGPEVAKQVIAASAPEVSVAGRSGRPHLDLRRAVELQLAAAGVARVTHLALCTRCGAEPLWSYRREGAGVGRNFAFAWLEPGSGRRLRS